jgi:antitoxin ChpS
VALFGSKARGDFHAESDLDILVVVRTTKADYRRLWNEMVDMAWRVELTFGVVISLIIKDLADYDVMRAHQLLLARNIERDGVDLWTRPSNAPTSRSDSPKPATIS